MKQLRSRLRGRCSWPRTRPPSKLYWRKSGQLRGIKRSMPVTSMACHFAARVIQEAMRLFPPAPGIARISKVPMEIAGTDRCEHACPHSCFCAASERRSLGQSERVRSGSLCTGPDQKTFAICLFALRCRTAHLHWSRILDDRGRRNTGDGCPRFLLSAYPQSANPSRR